MSQVELVSRHTLMIYIKLKIVQNSCAVSTSSVYILGKFLTTNIVVCLHCVIWALDSFGQEQMMESWRKQNTGKPNEEWKVWTTWACNRITPPWGPHFHLQLLSSHVMHFPWVKVWLLLHTVPTRIEKWMVGQLQLSQTDHDKTHGYFLDRYNRSGSTQNKYSMMYQTMMWLINCESRYFFHVKEQCVQSMKTYIEQRTTLSFLSW